MVCVGTTVFMCRRGVCISVCTCFYKFRAGCLRVLCMASEHVSNSVCGCVAVCSERVRDCVLCSAVHASVCMT